MRHHSLLAHFHRSYQDILAVAAAGEEPLVWLLDVAAKCLGGKRILEALCVLVAPIRGASGIKQSHILGRHGGHHSELKKVINAPDGTDVRKLVRAVREALGDDRLDFVELVCVRVVPAQTRSSYQHLPCADPVRTRAAAAVLSCCRRHRQPRAAVPAQSLRSWRRRRR